MEKRRDQLLGSESHDPTKPTKKLADPTVCPDCEATFRDGRWSWKAGPVDAPRHRCSACERIKDDYPAGYMTARGRFVKEHRDEVIRIARNVETREKEEHPIKRIMDIAEDDQAIVFRTTERNLAQAIGKALHSALKGDLALDFQEDIVRVEWQRDV